MHNANHCLGMFYMLQNLCFRKPKIISVANLISLSGLEEKKSYLVMYPANNSGIHFSSTIQSLWQKMDCAGKCHFRKTGIALDKETSALGSSELGKKWWDLPLALQALQRAHLPEDNRKIGGHPPLSSWNFPSCWRNLQIEFKFCGCWCCAFGRDTSGFLTRLVWGRFGKFWGYSGTEPVWTCQHIALALSLPSTKAPHRVGILQEWKWSPHGCWRCAGRGVCLLADIINLNWQKNLLKGWKSL